MIPPTPKGERLSAEGVEEDWTFADLAEAYEAAPVGAGLLERERFIADWFRQRGWFKRRAKLEGDLEVGVGWSVVDLPAAPAPAPSVSGDVEILRAALQKITEVRVYGHDNIWAGADRCRKIASAALAALGGQ